MRSLKCTVIGGLAGKTALIQVFTHGQFPTSSIPTVVSLDSRTLELDNEEILVNILDTSCQESFEELRKQVYIGTDVIILAFSVNGYIENIENVWMKDIQSNFRGGQVPPIVLVGTMVDLRGEERHRGRPLTTYKDGVMLAKKIGARRYMECSAKKDMQSCHEVFEAAVREALKEEAPTSTSSVLQFSCFKAEHSRVDDER